jgi:hypothetical protein
VLQSIVDDLLGPDDLPTTLALVGGDDHLRLALMTRSRSESEEKPAKTTE